MTVKDYLDRVRATVEREKYLSELIERVEARMDVSGYSFSDTITGGSAGNGAIPRAISDYWKICQLYTEQLAFCTLLQQQAAEMFYDMRFTGSFNEKALACAEMYYLYGMTFDEIARRLDANANTVDRVVHRLLKHPEIEGYLPMDAA